ncbi:MAG: DUF1508 domain-containing protein [Pyrinomonadaceae bacterium]
MTTIIKANEDSALINVPFDELKKLGFAVGDEVEFLKKNDEIILRSAAESERKRRFEQAKTKIFEEWNDVFVALAEGVDSSVSNDARAATKGKFILSKSKNGEYKFALVAENNRIVFESKSFKSKETTRKAINLMKNEIFEIKDEILNIPIQTELVGA